MTPLIIILCLARNVSFLIPLGAENAGFDSERPQSWKRDLWSLLFSSWFHTQHTNCSLYLWDLKACRVIKRNQTFFLARNYHQKNQLGTYRCILAGWGKEEGSQRRCWQCCWSLSTFCRVSFHPDPVSFWIRNPTFFDLPELCLLWWSYKLHSQG